jgi:hypothetical protein
LRRIFAAQKCSAPHAHLILWLAHRFGSFCNIGPTIPSVKDHLRVVPRSPIHRLADIFFPFRVLTWKDSILNLEAGLPDFSWYNIPKQENNIQKNY